MPKPDYPVTPAVRFLRAHKVPFAAHLYPYREHGGTAHSAQCLGVAEHSVIKTIVLQNEHKQGCVMLMHGDKQISTRNLARQLGWRHLEPATPQQAHKWTGYLVGGTSPFGMKTALPVYAQTGIFALPEIYINGGKRGFLVSLAPDVLHLLPATAADAVSE
ncbi:aminoacyl-tRNA deacylase [Conchiformibius kuhniae]|uniref:Cys-tRNA(Pro)/Cys-tRNA(Cys) deacylase n=1 Tax=Conchiformibius kuhniae TaxID=211502 RepID=A0A8T9MUX0_9NEIS|nr:aminoacyl-tRNA deacylase [Conchiformibius kuhniae]UOP04991.1 aminoacyl-tRNA deacylase [Conchiformibius kuhniae]